MAVKVEVVNLFLWKQLEPEHLALAPLGSLPVLAPAPGRALVGRVRLQLRTSWPFRAPWFQDLFIFLYTSLVLKNFIGFLYASLTSLFF